jgi:hypothetical protein
MQWAVMVSDQCSVKPHLARWGHPQSRRAKAKVSCETIAAWLKPCTRRNYEMRSKSLPTDH